MLYSYNIAKYLATDCDLSIHLSDRISNLSDWNLFSNKYTYSTFSNYRGFITETLFGRSLINIVEKIKKINPDVIYYPFFHPWIPFLNRHFKNYPIVYTCHDPVLHLGEKSISTQILQNLSIHRADHVIILDHDYIDIIKKYHKTDDQISVIPHGAFVYPPISFEKNINTPTILFFGRIVAYKGLDVLLKAFSIVRRSIPSARLKIVGRGNISQYSHQISQPGIELINDWVDEKNIPQYFLESDVVVCPYISASQSGVIPMAYGFGLPVIGSDIHGLRHQIIHEKTGLLFPVSDVEKLAQSIIRLLSEPEQRLAFGQNGLNLVKTDWHWSRIADDVSKACFSAQKCYNNKNKYKK